MKRKSLRTILLAFMFSMLPMLLEAQQEKRPQPGTKLTDEQIKQWVAPMRAGRKLTPKSWPNGAKVAVCLSWDMDNETFEIAAGHSAPVLLSQGEYGFTEGRSEEHTSELQSPIDISYAVFCLKKKKK